MSADLLERARSAVTVEKEALVVFEAVQHSALPVEQRRELCRIIVMAGKDVPRPVLLGVVAALVPEGARYVLNSERGISYRSENGVRVTLHPLKMPPHMLLLIAILEASHDH